MSTVTKLWAIVAGLRFLSYRDQASAIIALVTNDALRELPLGVSRCCMVDEPLEDRKAIVLSHPQKLVVALGCWISEHVPYQISGAKAPADYRPGSDSCA
jgi:hypothetical protein